MSTKTLAHLRQFHRGIINSSAPADLPDGALADATNVMVDTPGQIRTMGKFTTTSKGGGVTIPPGAGLHSYETDVSGSEQLIALGDQTNANVDVRRADGTLVQTLNLGSNSGFTPAFYSVEGVLRVADRRFANSAAWFGYIDRWRFGSAVHRTGWLQDTVGITRPDHIYVNGATSNGGGFNCNVTAMTDASSPWLAGTYEIAGSFVYAGGQESRLRIQHLDRWFTLQEGEYPRVVVEAAPEFNHRILGGRIYYRHTVNDTEWKLLIDVDLQEGVRTGIDQEWTAWTGGPTTYSATRDCRLPSATTYTALNGFGPDLHSLDFGDSNAGWTTAAVTGRRVFTASVRRTNPDNQLVTLPDQIFYTPVNRFDTFPWDHRLDLGLNDGEAFTALVAYADRLLAFKQRTVSIINVGGTENSWYVEQPEPHKGVPHAGLITMTAYGPAWMNRNGAYLYDGQQVISLTAQLSDPSQPLQTPYAGARGGGR